MLGVAQQVFGRQQTRDADADAHEIVQPAQRTIVKGRLDEHQNRIGDRDRQTKADSEHERQRQRPAAPLIAHSDQHSQHDQPRQ